MKLPHLFASPHAGFCSRRDFLCRTGSGAGIIGLASLLADSGLLGSSAHAASPAEARNPLAPKKPHFPVKAKSVIWLFMNGGQSQVDTWDPKPELTRRDGVELKGFDKDTGFFTDQVGPLLKSPFDFRQYGQSGTWVSEIFPNLSRHVDDIAFIKSCHVETNVHDQALFQANTGFTRLGYPAAGSWLTYGLGSECDDLPGFIVLTSRAGTRSMM